MVDKSMVTLLQSAPHTQARADKIVAAWDQYLADMRTARGKSRFEEADEAAREAVAELHELEGRICPDSGEDAHGNARKGADGGAGSRNGVNDGRDLEQALQERLETGHIIGLSLILDVLDLHGGDA